MREANLESDSICEAVRVWVVDAAVAAAPPDAAASGGRRRRFMAGRGVAVTAACPRVDFDADADADVDADAQAVELEA